MFRLVATGVLAGISPLITACGSTPVAVDGSSSIVTTADDARSIRVARFLDAYMRGDFKAAKAIFTPDARFYWSDVAEPMDLAAWNEAVRVQHDAFRDFRMLNRSIITTTYPDEGTWTYVWTAWQATSKATGQPLTLPLHLAYRWDGNGISEEWGLFDKGRFVDELAMNLARMEASDEGAPWEWVLGTWLVTGDETPDELVHWTQPEPGVDFVLGDWIIGDGKRAVEVVGWEPERGVLTARRLGTDGSSAEAQFTEFGPERSMRGSYRIRSGDGTISHGRVELVRTDDNRMDLAFIDVDGTRMERTFRPAPMDDARRMLLPVVGRTDDWRTAKVHAVHQSYLANDIDAMETLFAAGCVHKWGDPGTEADTAAWRSGLERHHEVFADIRLDNLFEMTGEYPDGNIWTTSWFEWRGTVRATGEPVEFLVHAAHRWDGDKVVEEAVFFDVDRFASYLGDATSEDD